MARRCFLSGLAGATLLAQPVSHGPRELGLVTPREVSIQGGKVVVRVDSGGCTDRSSLRPQVRKDATGPVPRYLVTFERVRVDECKALLLEGVLLDYDLVRELGVERPCTLVVGGQVIAVPGPEALRQGLGAAAAKAVELELEGYGVRLKAAQAGTGPAGNVALFESRIAELKAQQEALRARNPFDGAEAPVPDEAASFLADPAYGLVVPPRRRLLTLKVTAPCRAGSLLPVEGASRSGPFFHLAGIAGNDYSRLKVGHAYQVVAYLVYRREYVAAIPDHYVYLAEVR